MDSNIASAAMKRQCVGRDIALHDHLLIRKRRGRRTGVSY
jgi:hypothetical protein